MKASKRRASLAESHFATSKPFTSPAIWVGNALASKCVMRPMPDLPAMMLDQAAPTTIPTGYMMPRPVKTSLLLSNLNPLRQAGDLFEVCFDIFGGLLD